MNYICQSCYEEIEDGEGYALPFDNIDNVCHKECVEDWFEMNLDNIICDFTTYIEEDKQ